MSLMLQWLVIDFFIEDFPKYIYIFKIFCFLIIVFFFFQVRWDCINPKKQQKKKNYKNSGVIVLDSIRVKTNSILDCQFKKLFLLS